MLTQHPAQCKYWQKWKGKNKIHVCFHCDKYEDLSCGENCILHGAKRIKSIPTSWGNTIQAESELYKCGFCVMGATIMALVSETCVPIYTYTNTIKILESLKHSYFAYDEVKVKNNKFFRCDTHKIMTNEVAQAWISESSEPPTQKQIELHNVVVNRQKEKRTRARNDDQILDDVVVFQRLVSKYGIDWINKNIISHSPTFCVFDTRGFRNVELDLNDFDINLLRKSTWLFVRKVVHDPPFNMPLKISTKSKSLW